MLIVRRMTRNKAVGDERRTVMSAMSLPELPALSTVFSIASGIHWRALSTHIAGSFRLRSLVTVLEGGPVPYYVRFDQYLYRKTDSDLRTEVLSTVSPNSIPQSIGTGVKAYRCQS